MTPSNPYWKWAVKSALVLVVVEGALRKWFLPQLNQMIYFVKDAVLITAYLSFLVRRDHEGLPGFAGVRVLMTTAAVIVGALALNPALGSPVIGVFGLKTYLCYAPLCFLVPFLFESTEEFQVFFRRYLLWIIPVCLIGIRQFYAAPDDPINRYAAEDAVISTYGQEGHVRITGTFSYITGHAVFLQIMGTLVFCVAAGSASNFWFALGIVQLVLIVGNMLMSGSRAPALILALTSLIIPLASGSRQFVSSARLRFFTAFGSAAATVAVAMWFTAPFTAFKERVEDTEEEIVDRVFQHYESFDELLGFSGLFGFGPGSTHPGSSSLRSALKLPGPQQQPPDFEAEWARTMMELGVPGWLVWYALRLYLIWALFTVWRSLHNFRLRLWALAALLIHLFAFNGSVVLNHTFGVYYWFLAGFIFLLPRLEAQEAQPAVSLVTETAEPKYRADGLAVR